MNETKNKLARDYAREKHKGQFRFDGVTPYFSHVSEVADLVRGTFWTTDPELLTNMVCAAYLHDVLEDTDTQPDEIEDIFGEDVRFIVEGLTKKTTETYEQYISRINQNPILSQIKVCDILANLGDSPSRKQVKKYSDTLRTLLLHPYE